MGRELTIAFQSRFGPQKWLGPATDETLVALAKAGKTKVVIFAPGFSADCLETLERPDPLAQAEPAEKAMSRRSDIRRFTSRPSRRMFRLPR